MLLCVSSESPANILVRVKYHIVHPQPKESLHRCSEIEGDEPSSQRAGTGCRCALNEVILRFASRTRIVLGGISVVGHTRGDRASDCPR